MEKTYDDVDQTLSSRSSTIQEGPRRFSPASVLGLGLLGVFLLAGLIGLAVHHHYSVGGAAADLSTVKANLTSVTEERDNLTERLQARDQLINQLKANLTKKTREVDRLQCLKITCPEGWRMFDCSCYLLSTEKATWEQSRDNCRAGGAHLVIVDSEEEREFITSMIKEDTWIGLSDKEEEGTRKRVDGSPLNLNLTFWDLFTGQPDNGGGDPKWGGGDPKWGEEDCAQISIFTYAWNDGSCRKNLPWICEKEA